VSKRVNERHDREGNVGDVHRRRPDENNQRRRRRGAKQGQTDPDWLGEPHGHYTALRCTNALIIDSACTESAEVGLPGMNACGWPGKLSNVTFPPAAA